MNENVERLQRVYEPVGAPYLLYRNEECYTIQDEEPAAPSSMDATTLENDLTRQNRSQARFYYPIDYHVLRPVLPEIPADFIMGDDSNRAERTRRKRRRQQVQLADEIVEISDTSDETSYDTDSNNRIRINDSSILCERIPIKEVLEDQKYRNQHSFALQQEARAHMLLTDVDVDDTQMMKEKQQILHAYQNFDANYVPANLRLKDANGNTDSYGLSETLLNVTRMYDSERRDRAEPAYMAPFDTTSLEEIVEQDRSSRVPSGSKRRQPIALSRDDPNAPMQYSNCILTIPCPCEVCRGKEQDHSWCLLHPTGPLLDKVSLSYLHLPREQFSFEKKSSPAQLDVGDSLRQLAQCGADTYVARTTIHCIVFAVSVTEPPKSSTSTEGSCWGNARLKELQRIDLRSFVSDSPSYQPVNVACHPKYGSSWTDPKIAILCESDKRVHNVIYHVLAGPSLRDSKHVISNLQDISKIDFSSNHPMVLWAAGRSYIRPALTANHLSKHPRVGHGYSLFSIDLRTNLAAFQWSPSAEDYMIEGIHSLSGIFTDWNRDNCLWVSSISAGKTWELDTRMPCRAVNSWSLPHACDDCGPVLPATGLYGAGTIFTQPSHGYAKADGTIPCPTLSVGLSPETTFGIHLYQRPDMQPRFQTKSLECASCPGLAFYGKMSIATSSVYPLPDASESTFTCGLSSIRVSASRFLSAESIVRMGYREDDVTGVLCVVSATNKGDIYTHSLLESQAGHKRSRNFEGLPVGSTALAIPKVELSSKQNSVLGNLHVSLSSQYPPPSTSIAPARPLHSTIPGLPRGALSTEGAVTAHEDAETIEPKLMANAVVWKERDRQAPVKMASQLVHGGQRKLASTIDCFDACNLSAVQRDASQRRRSDLTPDLLKKMTKAWPNLEGNSDSD